EWPVTVNSGIGRIGGMQIQRDALYVERIEPALLHCLEQLEDRLLIDRATRVGFEGEGIQGPPEWRRIRDAGLCACIGRDEAIVSIERPVGGRETLFRKLCGDDACAGGACHLPSPFGR